MKRSKAKFLKLFISCVLISALSHIIYKSWTSIVAYEWECNWWILLASLFPMLIFDGISALCWQQTLRLCGHRLPLKDVYAVHVFSHLARYLPGGIWDMVGRISFLKKKHNVLFPAAAASSILDLSLILFAGGLIFLFAAPTFSVFSPQKTEVFWGVLIIVLFSLLLMYPPLLEKLLNTLPEKFRNDQKIILPFTYREIIAIVPLFLIRWFFFGSAFFVLIYSVYPLMLSNLLTIIAFAASTWIAGFLVFFMPNGAGIRELTLIIVLGSFMPASIAIVTTLGFRVLIVCGDLTSAFFGFLIYRQK